MTSDDLIRAFHAAGLSEVDGMNALQNVGVISDNCVWAIDVAEADIPKAIEWIQNENLG